MQNSEDAFSNLGVAAAACCWYRSWMKRRTFFRVLGAIAGTSLALAESTPTLDVHEWGTFTVVSGSDGQPIRWYQPRKTLAELPAFVIPQGQSINSNFPRGITKSGPAQDAAELPALALLQGPSINSSRPRQNQFTNGGWGTLTLSPAAADQAQDAAELPALVLPQGLSINSSLPRQNQLSNGGWGTLTLSPVAAEQEPDAAELPAFVLPEDRIRPTRRIPGFVVAGKTGTATWSASQGFFVRMETPVIYFYPNEAMPVSVEVSMRRGHITEWFPQHALGGADGMMRWAGDLSSPADPAAVSRLLPVDAAHGARYARAREVPDAWFFHTDAAAKAARVAHQVRILVEKVRAGAAATPAADDSAEPPPPESWEKFIFYRGAGNELPPYRVEALPNGMVRLSHHGDGGGIRAAFLLEIGSRGARWGRIDPLPEMTGNQGTPFVDGDLKMPAAALPKGQEDLGAAMRVALTEAGLTSDEAKAMVATWGDLWFSETGTRVLAILPRAWVDSVLPLSITPAPSKLARVFVARFEVFTQEREQALLSLLGAGEKPDADALEKFRTLHLDRFATAALERARRLADERMRKTFTELQADSPPPRNPADDKPANR